MIGKKLTADLLSKGYSVNYLTTRKSKIKSSKQINGYYWDPEKDIIDLQCFKNVDTIIKQLISVEVVSSKAHSKLFSNTIKLTAVIAKIAVTRNKSWWSFSKKISRKK